MAEFDPDAYLAATQPTHATTPAPAFDPDAYLKATAPTPPVVQPSQTAPSQSREATRPTISLPNLTESLFGPTAGQTVQHAQEAAGDIVRGIPSMATQTAQTLYDVAKFKVGTPQQGTEAVADILGQASQQAKQIASDVQSPLGSRESFRGLAQMGMLALPGLTESLFGRVRPEIPPVQAETHLTEAAAAQPIATETAVKETPNASQITSPEGIPVPQIRQEVGGGTPLRQQGEIAAARQAGAPETQGAAPQEPVAPTVPQPEQPVPEGFVRFPNGDVIKARDESGNLTPEYLSASAKEVRKATETHGALAQSVSEAGQPPVTPIQPKEGAPTAEIPTITGAVTPQGQVVPLKETTELPKPDEAPADFGKRLVEEVPPPQTPKFTAARGKATESKTTIEETTGVRPNPASVREQLSNSITRAQALSEYLRGQEKGSQIGAKAATTETTKTLQVADKWLAGDQERVRKDMTEFVNKTLPPDERGRFIGAIGRALSRAPTKGDPTVIYRRAFRVMQAIQNRSEVVYKGNLIDEIKNTASKSAESPSVDVAYRRRLQDVMAQFSLTKPSEGTLSRLKSLQDFVTREKAAGREPGVPQEQLDQITRLHRLPLKDMDVNAVERLRDDVKNIVSIGKVKANLLEAAWDNKKAGMIAEMQKQPASPIESRPISIPQPTEKLGAGDKFMNGVKQGMNAAQTFQDAIAPMDEIYDRLGNGNGSYQSWPSRYIKGNLDLGENSKLSELVPIRDQSNALIKNWGLGKSDMEMVGLKGIINMIGRERLESMGVRPDIIDKVESKPLTKGQQAYYDFTRQHYDALGTRVQNIAHRLYQQDMEIVPNYVPLLRDWASFSEGAAPEPLIDPLGKEVPFNETATMDQLRRDFNPKIISRTEQGFLKDRIEGAKTPVQLNAEEVFLRHAQDALHFIHQQPTLKMLGEVVRSPEFQSKFGKVGQNIVLDNLDTVASQGYVNHAQRIGWLDWIRNSTSKGAVGFRIASNIVHSSQIGFEAYHAGGPGWWAKGLQTALTPEGQRFLRSNAAETYFRSGGEPAQADVEAMSKVGKAGFFVARNIDKLGAQATFLGRYMKEMSKTGIPVDDVISAPVNPDIQSLALQRMHRAVASPMGKDIPQMTSRGKAVGGNVSIARAINQFRNIFLDNWSNIRHDFLRVGVNQAREVIDHLRQGELAAGAKQVGDTVSHRAAIAAAALMGVAMETGIKMGVKSGTHAAMAAATGVEVPKRKDEPTYMQEFEHHLLNRVPGVGQISSALLYGETGIPVIDAVVNPIKETGQALVYSKKPETKAKHLIRAASSAATVLGVPGSSQAIELAQPKATQLLGTVLPDTSKKRVSNRQQTGMDITPLNP